MAHHAHYGYRERGEEREEEYDDERREGYERYEEYSDERRPQEEYERRTETEYEVEGGGYGRRMDEYEVQPERLRIEETTIRSVRTVVKTFERPERMKTIKCVGEAGAVYGAGVAMLESDEENVDPQNARGHNREVEIAEGVGLGGAGATLYGHYPKENWEARLEERLEELETGLKMHGWFD